MKSPFALLIGLMGATVASGQDSWSVETNGRARYVVESSHHEFRLKNVNMTFDLPVIRGAPELARMVARRMNAIRKTAIAELRQECGNHATVAPEDAEAPENLCEGYSNWSYEIAFANGEFLAVIITEDAYRRPSAHPAHGMETHTWTVRQPRELRLRDSFKPKTHYLRRLSQLVRAHLRAGGSPHSEAPPDWVDRGTEPHPDNFRAWFISENGLTILFQEYQVAPYGWGSSSVVIDFAELKPLLVQRGPVARLARKAALDPDGAGSSRPR